MDSTFTEKTELTIPGFGFTSDLTLNVSNIKEAEKRLVEARVVNPTTYSDLEYVYGEGYREAKKYLSLVGYEITRAQKKVEDVKSVAILDSYPEFLVNKKLKDSAQIRDAYFNSLPDYNKSLDRVNMLRAVENLLEGKVKVFENVCRYMRKEMDLVIRSGTIDNNKYRR